MRSQRKLWPFVSAVLVLLAVLCVGGWFAFRMQVTKAATGMLEDALQMEHEPRSRPVHSLPPITGSFGKCAEPRLDAYVDILKDEPEVCRAYRAPKAPPGKIPEECLAIVVPRNSMAWARGLMLCSHAQTAGMPEGIFTTGHKRNSAMFMPWMQAARILAWEIKASAATHQAGLALETCADVIATGRDLSRGGALLGSMVGAGIVKAIFPACAEAVASADPATRTKFNAALKTIAAGRPSSSAMIRDEGVHAGIEHFGFELDAKQREALPAELRERIHIRPDPLNSILISWQMLGFRAMTDDLRAIVDRPPAERAALVAALDEKHKRAAENALSVSAQEKLIRRAEESVALVDMLAAAAAIDTQIPVTTAAYTVTPKEGGFELTPVEPGTAKYTIQISR